MQVHYLTVGQVEQLHESVLRRSGGGAGVRDRGGIEAAVAQPQQTFGGADLYPSLAAKAGTLAFTLVMNHPFIDGNKRIGHAAMEAFLMLNGYEIAADVDEQERLFLQLAAGDLSRDALITWVETHVVPFPAR